MKFHNCIFVYLMLFVMMLSVSAGASENKEAYKFDERLYGAASYAEYALLPEIPNISSYSAYVYNVETGSVMYRKNQDDIVYPASTVKLMTAIVAYENIDDLQTVLTTTKSAYNASKGSNMALKIGEQFTAEQLLKGLLIRGANDAANVLAEYTAGDIDAFVDMMNAKAKELGMNHTHFTNPTGLHSEEMKTTARDIAILADYFYSNTVLFEMSNTKFISYEDTPYTVGRNYPNRNQLLVQATGDNKNYFYSKAMGMSMGSTPEAGNCVVTSAIDTDGMTYICVVMGDYSTDDTNNACLEAANLIKMCLDGFEYRKVLSEKTVVCDMKVELAVDTDHVTLIPHASLSALLPSEQYMDFKNDISIEPRIDRDHATAPVKEGQAYGEAVIKYKDEIILGAVELAASSAIEKSNVLYMLNSVENFVFSKWFTVFIITAVILLLIYFMLSAYFSSRQRKLKHYKSGRFNKL